MLEHNFRKYPELTDNQMGTLYFQSPHKQITQDFFAKVTKVIDGDTIRVKWQERDFDFKIRFANIAAAELNEGGEESKKWLERKILGETVRIDIDEDNRVDKWGRLIGKVIHNGIDVGEESILAGMAEPYGEEANVEVPNIESLLEEVKLGAEI